VVQVPPPERLITWEAWALAAKDEIGSIPKYKNKGQVVSERSEMGTARIIPLLLALPEFFFFRIWHQVNGKRLQYVQISKSNEVGTHFLSVKIVALASGHRAH
jgi:hypothetical protein